MENYKTFYYEIISTGNEFCEIHTLEIHYLGTFHFISRCSTYTHKKNKK